MLVFRGRANVDAYEGMLSRVSDLHEWIVGFRVDPRACWLMSTLEIGVASESSVIARRHRD